MAVTVGNLAVQMSADDHYDQADWFCTLGKAFTVDSKRPAQRMILKIH